MSRTVGSPKKNGGRKALSLKDKMEIISELKANLSQTALANSRNTPVSTICKIWKNRVKIEKEFQTANSNSRRCQPNKFDKIDEAMLLWFRTQRNRSLPISGPILKEKAHVFAESLGISDFKCSNGWLDKWKKRHNIVFRSISGESAAVDVNQVSTWLEEKWKIVAKDYSPQDVFNCDETGLFWRMLPEKSLAFSGEKCSGGKHSKERLTVLLCCNLDGSEKLTPLIIGKSAKPRAFSRLRSLSSLPVDYKSNTKAWMTGKIFEEWLKSIDKKMVQQKRNILMLLDNCPAHPPNVALNNVKLLFLPPNTTSILQPLDQGIIQNFKGHYRSRLLRKLIHKLDSNDTNKIDVLDALFLMRTAWDKVSSETIANCFRKAELGIVGVDARAEEADYAASLNVYANVAGVGLPVCGSWGDYISLDENLVTSMNPTDEEILSSVAKEVNDNEQESEASEEENEVETQQSNVTSKDAILALETLKKWIFSNDESGQLVQSVMNIEDFCMASHLAKLGQPKIHSFFKKTN